MVFVDIIDFTDEEGYGKYLDLHECYEKYINLKGVDRVDYLSYLATFDQLFEIPKERKNSEYRKYGRDKFIFRVQIIISNISLGISKVSLNILKIIASELNHYSI